jgi:hypothetical protein
MLVAFATDNERRICWEADWEAENPSRETKGRRRDEDGNTFSDFAAVVAVFAAPWSRKRRTARAIERHGNTVMRRRAMVRLVMLKDNAAARVAARLSLADVGRDQCRYHLAAARRRNA